MYTRNLTAMAMLPGEQRCEAAASSLLLCPFSTSSQPAVPLLHNILI